MSAEAVALPDLAGVLASMPILSDAEVQLLPLARRREVLARERMLAGLKADASRAAAAHDVMMRGLAAQGRRAAAKREETARVVAEIVATPVVPDPDGPENFRRLAEAIGQNRARRSR